MITSARRAGLLALCLTVSCWGIPAFAASLAKESHRDPMEAARTALRTLQFQKAIALLEPTATAGNADAQYLLGLMYLNGVGVATNATRALVLLQAAAEHGQGAAAYVLAAQLANAEHPDEASVTQWLERSARLGYSRAIDVLG